MFTLKTGRNEKANKNQPSAIFSSIHHPSPNKRVDLQKNLVCLFKSFFLITFSLNPYGKTCCWFTARLNCATIFAVGGEIIAERMKPMISLVYIIPQESDYSEIKAFFVLHVGVIAVKFTELFNQLLFNTSGSELIHNVARSIAARQRRMIVPCSFTFLSPMLGRIFA